MVSDPRAGLEALGASDVPPLGDDRLRAIEDRVMAATTRRPADHRRAVMLTVAAALVGVLLAGIVLATAERGGVRLELADGVTLELPDEVRGPGVAGERLPDGTVISIAEGGRAVIGDRRYGPGRYVVVDGEIETLADQDPTSDSSTTTTMPRDESGPTRPAGASDAPGSTTTTGPATRTATTTTEARPDDRPPVERTIPRRDRERPATTPPRSVDRPTTMRPAPTTRPDLPTTSVPTDRRQPLAPTTTHSPTTTHRPTTTPAVARDERRNDRP